MESTEHTKPRLLLVDDDRLVLATLSEGLRDAGYDVSAAASAEQAIARMQDGGVDLAILDVRMPGMDGIALSALLREHSTVPFLFLSAHGDLDIVRQAAGNGALGYLLKPIDIPQLVPSIEAALARGAEISRLKDSELRLNTALSTEQKTRMAVGVLMERRRLDRRAAFETLRRMARSQRRKITLVADDIVRAVETLNGTPQTSHDESAPA